MSEQDKIKDILAKYGERMEGNIWYVQSQTVIRHKAVERIGAKAGITFDPPTILRAERDEAVIMVSGRLGERWDWDIGEALVGVNYRVSGKQAAYTYAMAMKRARDRLVLKLIGIHGMVYSEEEADDFGAGKPQLVEAEPEAEEAEQPDWAPIQVSSGTGANRQSAYAARKGGKWEPLVDSLRECPTIEALHSWTAENGPDIEALPAGWVAELREEWKARAKELKAGRN